MSEDHSNSKMCVAGKLEKGEEEEPVQYKGRSKEDSNFRTKWKDQIYRENFRYSMYMAAVFVALGMYVGQLGSTFLDLQIITNSDLASSSAYFTSGSAGYLSGSVLTGLVYNKMNKPFLMFITTFFLGVTNILTTYCKWYELMIFIRFVTGIFAGGVDTGGNSEHMRIWGDDANGLLQFLHFCFAFGGVISPLFAEPFLAAKDDSLQKDEMSVNGSGLFNATDPVELKETRVEYVFLITGIFIILTSIPWLMIYVQQRKKAKEKPKEEVQKRKFSQRAVPFSLLILMLVGVCLFYFTYCCVEDTFFSFLMTFLVEEYDSVSKSKGATTTSVAWASFAFSRFLMIFMTKLFTTVQLLLLMTISMAVAYSSFTLLAYYRIVDALVVFSAIAPLSLSGVFPAGFSWMESEMFKVTGIISSCILVSSSLGSVINPVILGHLMEEYSNMWYCYLLLIDTFIMCSLLFILLIFSRYYIDKKYGSMGSSEMTITPQDKPPSNKDECNENCTDDEVKISFL